MTIQTLTLQRATHCLCDIHRLISRSALILYVRYTKTNMIVVYRPCLNP